MENEIWAETSVSSDYICSNYGKFIRVTPGKGTKPMKPIGTFINKVTGYSSVTFSGCSPRTFAAHKIIARAHVPNPNNYTFVLFKDGNKNNLRADNLYWSPKTYTPNIKPVWIQDADNGEIFSFPSKRSLAIEMECSSYFVEVCLKKGNLLLGKWKIFDKNPALHTSK